MEIWNLTQAEIDAAHARAGRLQLADLQHEIDTWAPSIKASEWREHKRRAEWWDEVILWASAVGIVVLVVLLALGVMR